MEYYAVIENVSSILGEIFHNYKDIPVTKCYIIKLKSG